MAVLTKRPEAWIASIGLVVLSMVGALLVSADRFEFFGPGSAIGGMMTTARQPVPDQAEGPGAGSEPSADLAAIAAERDAATRELTLLQERNRIITAERGDLAARAADLAIEIQKLRQEKTERRSAHSSAEAEAERFRLEVEALEQRRAQLADSLKSKQIETDSLRKELTDASSALVVARREIEELRQDLAAMASKDVSQVREIDDLKRTLRRLDLANTEATKAQQDDTALRTSEAGSTQKPKSRVGPQTSPPAFVQVLVDELVGSLSNNEGSAEKRTEASFGVLKDNVDLTGFGRAVLGAHWDAADTAQRREYEALFMRYLLRPFVRMVGQEGVKDFKVTGSKKRKGDETEVETMIVTQSGARFNWIWVVRQNGGRFNIADLKSHGVSLLSVYRSELGSYLSNNGLNAFLENLRTLALAPG